MPKKKVEGYHFDMRKHVLEYDDVMEKQRSIIYQRSGKSSEMMFVTCFWKCLRTLSTQLMDQYCQEKYTDQWDLQGFNRAFEAVFSELPASSGNWKDLSRKNTTSNSING